SEKRFLYYPWGVWITAYARQNLWALILESGNDYVYSDTDSVKMLNAKNHIDFLDNYNILVEEKLMRMNAIYQFDEELLFPSEKVIGTWDFEGTYSRFKTLGPKRYLYEKNNELFLTIAGLSSEKGLYYLQSEAMNVDRDVFDLFDTELYIPPLNTGKLLHTYIDTPAAFEVTDCAGITSSISTMGGVHLMGTDFTLSLETEVGHVLEMLISEGYLKEGTYYDGH